MPNCFFQILEKKNEFRYAQPSSFITRSPKKKNFHKLKKKEGSCSKTWLCAYFKARVDYNLSFYIKVGLNVD